jgi:site-specific DNA recombinase
MRLIGYTRVSPIEQEYNDSLPDQERRIKAYCQALNYELVEIVHEVTTGTKKNVSARTEFNRVLDMLRQDQADGIVALKLDRLVRNAKDVLMLVDGVLKPLNKNLILLDVQLDTSAPNGRMILTMMGAVAQLEAGMNRERAKLKDSSNFAKKTVSGEIVPDQEDLDAIEAIRRQHKSGKSFQAIAAWMNLNGYKTDRGSQWQANSVKRVVDSLENS